MVLWFVVTSPYKQTEFQGYRTPLQLAWIKVWELSLPRAQAITYYYMLFMLAY